MPNQLTDMMADVLERLGPDVLDECARTIFEAVTQTDLFEAAAVNLAITRGRLGSAAEPPSPAYVEAFTDVVNYATAHALAVIKSHWES